MPSEIVVHMPDLVKKPISGCALFLLMIAAFFVWRVFHLVAGTTLKSQQCRSVVVEVVEHDALNSGLFPGLFEAIMALPVGSGNKRYEILFKNHGEQIASFGCYWTSERYPTNRIGIQETHGESDKISVSFGRSHYSVLLSRWLLRGPIGYKGGLNPNAFATNSPVNRVDLLGMQEAYKTTLDVLKLLWSVIKEVSTENIRYF